MSIVNKDSIVAKQLKATANRTAFAKDIDARTRSGQRLGMFSQAMPLTIGDASTNYQCDRRPKEIIGKQRNFSNSRGRITCGETFNPLVSNAIGDEYRDTGKYFLRSEAGKKSISKSAFRPGGAQVKVKHSEFLHLKEFADHHPGPLHTPVNFMARSTYEAFQKKNMYTEDAFERKEDMRKLDY